MDKHVTDEELISLIIELERFREKCKTSELPNNLKSKIVNLKIDFTVKGVKRGSWYTLVAFATFGAWTLLVHYRQQRKRKQTLNGIRFDTSRLSSYVKLNY